MLFIRSTRQHFTHPRSEYDIKLQKIRKLTAKAEKRIKKCRNLYVRLPTERQTNAKFNIMEAVDELSVYSLGNEDERINFDDRIYFLGELNRSLKRMIKQYRMSQLSLMAHLRRQVTDFLSMRGIRAEEARQRKERERRENAIPWSP